MSAQCGRTGHRREQERRTLGMDCPLGASCREKKYPAGRVRVSLPAVIFKTCFGESRRVLNCLPLRVIVAERRVPKNLDKLLCGNSVRPETINSSFSIVGGKGGRSFLDSSLGAAALNTLLLSVNPLRMLLRIEIWFTWSGYVPGRQFLTIKVKERPDNPPSSFGLSLSPSSHSFRRMFFPVPAYFLIGVPPCPRP